MVSGKPGLHHLGRLPDLLRRGGLRLLQPGGSGVKRRAGLLPGLPQGRLQPRELRVPLRGGIAEPRAELRAELRGQRGSGSAGAVVQGRSLLALDLEPRLQILEGTRAGVEDLPARLLLLAHQLRQVGAAPLHLVALPLAVVPLALQLLPQHVGLLAQHRRLPAGKFLQTPLEFGELRREVRPQLLALAVSPAPHLLGKCLRLNANGCGTALAGGLLAHQLLLKLRSLVPALTDGHGHLGDLRPKSCDELAQQHPAQRA
mmetsp:Transcript_86249/g.272053  ORF Transcript_86249/g.272053 Transcript_86249/m.272053 type:complete len:259 (-) Transcript_86249:64-840(-)